MLVWLIPISAFWVMTALYLGGMAVEVEGGSGFQQLLGLLLTFVLYLLVWWGLRALLGGFAGALGGIALPTLFSTLLLPVLTRLAFRVTGSRVQAAGEH